MKAGGSLGLASCQHPYVQLVLARDSSCREFDSFFWLLRTFVLMHTCIHILLNILKTIICIYSCVCMCLYIFGQVGEIRGQCEGVGSLLRSCRTWGLDTYC